MRKSTENYDIDDEYIQKVVKHIEVNYRSHIDIDAFTKMVPLSIMNLEMRFKKEMDTTIYQFILRCRVDYFSHLLVTTDRTLYDMALESGFVDCKNISRTFKKFKGCTPAEYRKRHQELSYFEFSRLSVFAKPVSRIFFTGHGFRFLLYRFSFSLAQKAQVHFRRIGHHGRSSF